MKKVLASVALIEIFSKCNRFARSCALLSLIAVALTTSVAMSGATVMADDVRSPAYGAVQSVHRMYVGPYTGDESKGIYLYEFDTSDGRLTSKGLAGEAQNPSFQALHPTRPLLYSVGEMGAGGAVYAFKIDTDTGKLTLLNTVSSVGPGPCHIAVDQTGQCVVIANYGGGSVASYAFNDDGSLSEAKSFFQHEGSGPNQQRQKGPHAHCANFSPDNRFVLVNDLGLDKLFVYRVDPKEGTIEPNDPPFAKLAPGAGPRHLAFHPNGKIVYVINELDSTVTVFDYDAENGKLTEKQTITTLPEGFDGQNTTAEIFVHPSGKFVYGSNRGHNSIVVYAVDPDSGKLSFVQRESSGGDWPRNFVIDPSGRYLLVAHQKSDDIIGFEIDQNTGKIKPTGVRAELSQPVCITFGD